MMKKNNPIYGDSLMVERNNSLFFLYPYIAVCYKHGVVPIGAFKFLQGKQ